MNRADGSVTLFPTEAEIEQATQRASDYKPAHGGYPSYVRMGAGGKIVPPPTSPIPGSEWNDGEYTGDRRWATKIITEQGAIKSSIYFDAVRLSNALDQQAHDLQAQAWKLTTAMRRVRLATTKTQMEYASDDLAALYHDLMDHADLEVKVRMQVNDLANTIDDICPSQSPMMKPVRGILARISNVFKRTDG